MTKLEYKNKKWDKEEKTLRQFLKSTGGKLTGQNNLEAAREQVESLPRTDWRYANFLCAAARNYTGIAQDWYLLDQKDWRAVDYTWLAAFCRTLAEELDCREDPADPLFGLEMARYQFIAAGEEDAPCLRDRDSVAAMVFSGEYDQAAALLAEVEEDDSLEEGSLYLELPCLKRIYKAILAKDETRFHEELARRIKKYRRNMAGYSPVIDIVSVVLVKLANRAGLSCPLSVIEVPELFFRPEHPIPKETLRPPLWEEIMAALGAKKEEQDG